MAKRRKEIRRNYEEKEENRLKERQKDKQQRKHSGMNKTLEERKK